MKKFLILLFATAIVLHGQKLTLRQSLDLGLKKSRGLKTLEIKEKIAEYQMKKILSRFFPKFVFNASYSRLSNVPPFEVSIPIMPNPLKIQDAFLNYYNLRAGFQTPIFVGFKLTSLLKASENNLKADELNFSRKKNEKAFEIINAFWNFRKAQLTVKLVKQSLNRLKAHLKEVKNYFKNGRATKNDLLRMKLQVSNVRVKLLESESILKIARTAFNKSVGLDLLVHSKIAAEKIKTERDIFDLKNILKEGLKNRIEIKVSKEKIKAAEENIKAAESEWFPSLSAFGNYYYNRPNQRYLPLKDEFKDSWDVGVSLNWTLWDWGGRSSGTAIAENNFLIGNLNLQTLKENIKAQIISDFQNFKDARTRIENYKLSVKSAEENLRVTNQLFKEGEVKVSDVIDAETELLEAKTNYENALIDFAIAKARLYKSLGRKIY